MIIYTKPSKETTDNYYRLVVLRLTTYIWRMYFEEIAPYRRKTIKTLYLKTK
jgi:hypothetical protein